jgi:hypothetical protein
MTSTEDQLEQKKSKVLVENNAQAIFDHLTELSNLGGIHERRWLWELLQNAKDSVKDSQAVSIEVELRDDELIFKHNGNPFTEDEVIHLIYHGSTKKGAIDKTGKFGTGFLTTHLLSRRVGVSGTLDGGRGFTFLLDRSGNDPKEVERAMESSWQQFKESGSSIAENHFTTNYSYSLDEQSQSIAQKGIQDLPKLLPFVLAFNSKFDRFTLKTGEVHRTFRRAMTDRLNNTGIITVTIEISEEGGQSSPHTLALATENKTAVAVPLTVSDESISVKPIEPDVPRLFFDFPLFGTEDFSFPAIINSSDFIPKSERDGVYLGDKTNDDITANKQIVENACRLYSDLVDYACTARWGDLHLFAFINVPPKKDWLDFAWFKQTLQTLQRTIAQKAIVRTDREEYVSPINALFPIDAPLPELWDFAVPLFADKLPAKTHLDSWFEVLKSWASLFGKAIEDFESALTLSKLCKAIAELQTLEALTSALQSQNPGDTIIWLNKLYDLIIRQSKKHLLEALALIPNQNGILSKKTPSLFLDDGIDDTIKDISKAIGDDWRDRLVSLGISLDKSLLAVKSQEEVLTATLSLLKQQAKKNNQDSSLLHPVIDTLVWLVQHQRADLLTDLPVATRNPEKESAPPYSCLSPSTRLLVPAELWQTVPAEYAELFPSEYIFSPAYHDRLTDTDWQFLSQNGLTYPEPIYEEDTELDYQTIFVAEAEQKAHQLDPIASSKIAFLDHPKDRSIIDRIRKSKAKSILFVKFILTCVIERDQKWLLTAAANCECGSSHSVVPSHWFYYVKSRKWVPSANGGSEALSAQSLATLLETEKSIISKLKEDRPALFLNKLGIGIGEILRNIVTGGDETKKLDWDKVFGAILTSEVDPAKLLAEFQERERNREKVLANQELGKRIESIFEATFSSEEFKALGFKVERTGIGSDYEVEHDFIDSDEEKLLDLKASHSSMLVEIKSTGIPFCRMTSTQAKKAVDNAATFCLCVVPLTGTEITDDIIRTTARFVTNIGELLRPKVSDASSLQDLRDEAVAVVGDIEIDISETQIKYRINQTVWETGKTFDEFVSHLTRR